ncbi:hypothetical protein D0Z70_17835 [Sphingobium terrigena]|uniref:Uncharacterized protein n=1 Tax=Sphingobium terrigena TaxID=2304063 RepID=A0A418YNT4_9SPHN|nr:hypothetical protein [Sphingobium terrigena]RJG52903.1 hypothetical protein D0Z70_17835 [Sphingobium terrigena]
MKLGQRVREFLLLQNMMLKDFIRQGLANRSLATEDAARLSRAEALNIQEMARWDRDLSAARNGATPPQESNG